jgi:uncharacterized protein
MRQPSAELFPTDSPVPAGQLIGRADDVDEIVAAMAAGTHLILAGPRRTGKTSVCEAALTRLHAQGLYTVEIDLFRIADAAELAETLAVKVVENRSGARQALLRARRMGRGALTVAQGAVALKMKTQLGDGVELAFTPGLAQSDPAKALDRALELPQRIAEADGKRLVLFFDEFQEIAGPRRAYGDPDAVTKRMRAIFQRSTHVSYLFAGSIEHVMRDLFAPGQRAFSGFGSFHALHEIPPDAWLEGLRERFAADDCTIEPTALERLVGLGEGHPRATMRIAQQTHLAAVQLGTHAIGADEVELGHRAALQGDVPIMEQLVETIRRLHKAALPMARSIAEGLPPPRHVPVGVRDRVLKQLRDAGVVERVSHGHWKIINPLFREYLVQIDPI